MQTFSAFQSTITDVSRFLVTDAPFRAVCTCIWADLFGERGEVILEDIVGRLLAGTIKGLAQS